MQDMKFEENVVNIGKAVQEDEAKHSVESPERMQEFNEACQTLHDIVNGKDVTIESKPHEPYGSMGFISVVAKDIVVEDTQKMAEVVKSASNVEVYPLTNGAIQINFTFHGLAK